MPRSTRASAMSSRRHLTFALGVAISLALAATAALSLVYTPRDPLAMAGAARLEGPSRTHPFGTDQYGRDVLSRVMAGAPTSIAVGVIAVGIGALARLVLGLARGLALRPFLPNTMAPLIVQATTSFPVAILAEAALAYLGLGTQPPHPSWGLMLKEAQNFLGMNPWFALFPGGAIAVAVLGLNL